MRFRLIEKDTVGTSTEFEQAAKKKLAHSKTYIGSKAKLAVDMNKIKNTKIGDDIHYYINGVEGRGIVVKMANEYLEVFKENGQLGTIHINDTFFVKDILVNKQWNDMDDQERYEALAKIHAPTPRFIMKVWEDLPEEIKILLQKSSKTINKVGSTYEEGESKESETKDHARTGFAQNEQFKKKKPCKCGDPECKDPKCEKHAEVKKAREESEEHRYNRQFDHAGNRKQTAMGGEKEILGHIVGQGKGSAKEQADKKAKEIADKKAKEANTKTETPKEDPQDPDNPNYTMSGKRITSYDRKHNPKHTKKAFYVEWLEKYSRESRPKIVPGTEQTEHEYLASRPAATGPDGTKYEARYFRDGVDHGTPEAYAKKFPKSATAKRLADTKKPASQKRSAKKKPTGKFSEVETESKEMTQAEKDRVATPEESNESFLKDAGKAETYADRATLKAYEVWLERQEKSQDVNKIQLRYEEHEQDSGKIEVEADPDNPGKMRRKRKPKQGKDKSDVIPTKNEAESLEYMKAKKISQDAKRADEDIKRKKLDNVYRSDVEHGVYGNVAGSDGVGVSTDTIVDVAEDTGYEERPHISVEEAGNLPRTTFNPHGKDELHVSGDGSKDKPKFSQPANQEQPVRKAGLPQQHPNTYGMRYGMKGGVKKVWCPEHQMWEETRKDWHE